MSDLTPIITSILAVIGTLITIFLGVRTLLRRPHIIFSLFEKAEISMYNEEDEVKITLVSDPIANEKKFWIGNTAKKTSVFVRYRAPSDNQLGLNTSIDIPFLNTYGTRTKIVDHLKSLEDIQNALEKHFFDRNKRDIPQGRGEYVAVAYGIQKTNQLFIASKPPIEIPLPLPEKRGKELRVCFLRLEIAGDNIPSTTSDGTMIVGDSWNNLSWPTKIETLMSGNKFENLLLRLGIGRKVKVLGSKK